MASKKAIVDKKEKGVELEKRIEKFERFKIAIGVIVLK